MSNLNIKFEACSRRTEWLRQLRCREEGLRYSTSNVPDGLIAFFQDGKTQETENLCFSGMKSNLIRIANPIRIVLLRLFCDFLTLLEGFVDKNCPLSFIAA